VDHVCRAKVRCASRWKSWPGRAGPVLAGITAGTQADAALGEPKTALRGPGDRIGSWETPATVGGAAPPGNLGLGPLASVTIVLPYSPTLLETPLGRH